MLVACAGVAAAVRLSAPTPAPKVTVDLTGSVHVPKATVRLPWPAAGQGAVAVPSIGVAVGSPAQKPVPVASLTKLMTAYVVLHDHPLAGAATGPGVTVTLADLADYDSDTVNDDSNALVALGEVLTERQLLERDARALGGQLRRHVGELGCRQRRRVRGEDEHRRRAARHEPDPLRRPLRHRPDVAVDGE